MDSLTNDQRRVLARIKGAAEPQPAAQLRAVLGMSHEQVYMALVHLEARGLARIVVDREPAETKAWESIE